MSISTCALREEGDRAHCCTCLLLRYFYPRPPRGGRRTPCPRLRHSPNFYPRPPRGGRPACSDVCHVMPPFLSTPSARRATSTPNSVRCCCTNFYPRPPRGGRHELRLISGCRFLFLSTPSARRATHRCAGGLNVQADFYPRPPRGGRRFVEFFIGKLAEFLSTPSARRATPQRHGTGGHPISIHALREEGDPGRDRRRRWSGHFYPRPPRGGRHAGEALRVGSVIISIHALREEGDLIRLLCMANSAIFLSTPSARRATAQLAALTAELEDFYPRPPRGGRPSTPPPWSSVAHFYPRPPRGGRPALPGDLLVLFFISIHALREEGDYFANSAKYQITLFLSTPSARRATRAATGVKADILFLSTPSARRATYAPCIFRPCRRFLSTPSARRATIVQQQGGWGKLFLSTPSARRATSL